MQHPDYKACITGLSSRLKEVESVLTQIAPKMADKAFISKERDQQPSEHTDGENEEVEEEEEEEEDIEKIKGKSSPLVPPGKANKLSHQQYVDVLSCLANNFPRITKPSPNTDHGWSYDRKAGKGHAHLIMGFSPQEGCAVQVNHAHPPPQGHCSATFPNPGGT